MSKWDPELAMELADRETASLKRDLALAESRLRTAEQERDEFKATVKKVWSALGDPAYEQMEGRYIWDLVAERVADSDRLRTAETALRETERERDEALSQLEMACTEIDRLRGLSA